MSHMLMIVSMLMFVAIVLFVYFGVPFLVMLYFEISRKRTRKFAADMERAMMQEDINRVTPLYFFGPLAFAALGFFFSPPEFQLIAVGVGFVVGFIIPRFYARMIIQKRIDRFNVQLVDALMIMSSSFRGGLSLIQSMEAVTEEMPDPIRQEFSIVLGENKMGVTMDDAMNRLYRRIPSPAMQQMVSSILLARETGGNLPLIFARIVQNIRERKKIEDNLAVLTVQGKLQALVMSGLPVGFFLMVNGTNPGYFRSLTTTELGHTLLWISLGLWLFGTFLIIKISSFKEV
jgi:tight adherence protein B